MRILAAVAAGATGGALAAAIGWSREPLCAPGGLAVLLTLAVGILGSAAGAAGAAHYGVGIALLRRARRRAG